MILYGILSPINLAIFGYKTVNVGWYLLAYAVILLLTFNENKYWLTFLFILSIILNFLDGHIIRPVNFELFKGNSSITFMYVFILGRFLRSLDFKLKPTLGKILVALSLVMMFLNGLYFHYDQFELYSIVTAVVIFIGVKDLQLKTNLNLARITLDIYIFHSFFVPLKLIFPDYYQYTIIPITILSVIFSIYTAKLFRHISNRYFNQQLYS